MGLPSGYWWGEDNGLKWSCLVAAANGKSWDCQVGFEGGDNRTRMGCLVAAGSGVGGSNEPHLEQDIDLDIQAEIDECIAYTNDLRDKGIDARVLVEVVDREESETGTRGPVNVRVERVTHPAMPEDTTEPAQEERAIECTYETLGSLVQRFYDHIVAIPVHRVHVIEGVQREQGRRIVRVESLVAALTERVAELERDNKRLRGTASVEGQRVDRLQRGMSRMQIELRQI
nr:hypothetical protein [Tanacetum cinerariifolium]